MLKIYLQLIVCLFFSQVVKAQTIELLHSDSTVSFRGLSVVNDRVVWASGSNGTIATTIDGGKTWRTIKVSGHEKRDFRDIEAFNAKTAIIMAVGSPGIILRTNDSGSTWVTVFQNSHPDMFLDAMDFNGAHGIVIGDPINARFFFARTRDQGLTWFADSTITIEADSAEACFAASGSNIIMKDTGTFVFVTGGRRSRFFDGRSLTAIPIVQGRESTGANGMATFGRGSRLKYAIAGGDFSNDSSAEDNFIFTHAGKTEWKSPASPPSGYRSGVTFINANTLVTCGINGADISVDGGNTWRPLNLRGFHVCGKSEKGKVVYFAGSRGRIGRLRM
jgi:photosystem II stability/assembly factor-like uncharacterized protein